MKYIYSEFKPDYDKYHFPYQVFAIIESDDDLSDVFSSGFLPTRISKNLFYLTRSLRVKLSDFEKSSENRRILRKTENYRYEVQKLDDFDYTIDVQKKSKDWLNSRFGRKIISAHGVRKVYNEEFNNLVFVWYKDREVVGYVPCIDDKGMLFYNYAFYNPQYLRDNLGARMMLEAVIYSKKKGKEYIYLGSCYTHGALYKTEFKGVEFYTGVGWSHDTKKLKFLVRDYNWDHSGYLFQDPKALRELFGIDKLSDLVKVYNK